MKAASLRVLVSARTPMVRAGLRGLLADAGFEVAGEIDGDSLPSAPAEDVPAPAADVPAADVLAADVLVADLGGGETLAELLEWVDPELAALPAVLLVDGPEAARPEAGDWTPPRAWLLRDASGPELAVAVAAVAGGMVVLDPSIASVVLDGGARIVREAGGDSPAITAREADVLRLLALGLPNKAIARRLGISDHTVKFHVGALLQKLDARSRTEAVASAVRRGLLAL